MAGRLYCSSDAIFFGYFIPSGSFPRSGAASAVPRSEDASTVVQDLMAFSLVVLR
jgi:hypothetical protein